MQVLACKYCGSKPVITQFHSGYDIYCPNNKCEPPCYVFEKTEAKAIIQWNSIYGAK